MLILRWKLSLIVLKVVIMNVIHNFRVATSADASKLLSYLIYTVVLMAEKAI